MTWHQLQSLTLSNKKQQLVTINLKQKHMMNKKTHPWSDNTRATWPGNNANFDFVSKKIHNEKNQPQAIKKQQLTTWSKGRHDQAYGNSKWKKQTTLLEKNWN